MRYELTVNTRHNRYSVTTGSDPASLVELAEFVGAVGFKDADAEWELAAEFGPTVSGLYGDITSVRLEVTA